jgi:cobalt/nickel transport protein
MIVNKNIWAFVFPALVVSVLLAILISPFASSSPDGLEKVAEDKGFLEKAEEQEPAWKHSPIPDYAVGGTDNELLATSVAGLIGTLLTFAVGLGLAKLIARKSRT